MESQKLNLEFGRKLKVYVKPSSEASSSSRAFIGPGPGGDPTASAGTGDLATSLCSWRNVLGWVDALCGCGSWHQDTAVDLLVSVFR